MITPTTIVLLWATHTAFSQLIPYALIDNRGPFKLTASIPTDSPDLAPFVNKFKDGAIVPVNGHLVVAPTEALPEDLKVLTDKGPWRGSVPFVRASLAEFGLQTSKSHQSISIDKDFRLAYNTDDSTAKKDGHNWFFKHGKTGSVSTLNISERDFMIVACSQNANVGHAGFLLLHIKKKGYTGVSERQVCMEVSLVIHSDIKTGQALPGKWL